MAALIYCGLEKYPSPAVFGTEPKGRSEAWTEGEAVSLVERRPAMKYYGAAGTSKFLFTVPA